MSGRIFPVDFDADFGIDFTVDLDADFNEFRLKSIKSGRFRPNLLRILRISIFDTR